MTKISIRCKALSMLNILFAMLAITLVDYEQVLQVSFK